ncbi:uncharacterized protein LOC105257674 [Camponotus floridanus]|uniref:uncharacterized protein LOC105257674 n=1 Tax=Camponotus floridanus TaxID=104421 RepID=UPI00059C9CC8|nr:uncharacterized protein LOC105257674 [Camponotus floridanus]
MQASLSVRTIGCIGKCTTGLTAEELDQITDNINKTLSHPKGRQIFERYLQQRNLQSSLECLELYKICSESLAKELSKLQSKDSDLESLIVDVMTVREITEDLDGVPQIDMALMERFNEALTNKTREALLNILEDTRDRSRDYLKNVHQSFKQYISEPCPITK